MDAVVEIDERGMLIFANEGLSFMPTRKFMEDTKNGIL